MVVRDTGFGAVLPMGGRLFGFISVKAINAIRRIESNYRRRSIDARRWPRIISISCVCWNG
jgi:hypothetical protein